MIQANRNANYGLNFAAVLSDGNGGGRSKTYIRNLSGKEKIKSEFMSENREQSNGRSSRQSRERTERIGKFLKDSEKFIQKDYMEHIRNRWADSISEEVAAAPEDVEAQAKEEAEIIRDIIREKKYNVFRKFFQKGIELKKDDPDSKLFKTAEQLLELLDQAESDISSIDKHQSRRYATLFSMYAQLFDAELVKQSRTKEEQVETPPGVQPAVAPDTEGREEKRTTDATYEVPWNDNTESYISLTEAVNMANDENITMTKMSRKLKDAEFPVHRMHRGRRCRVLLGDWRKWLKYAKAGKITDEAIDRYIRVIEQRKEKAREAKLRKKKAGKSRVI